MPDRVWSPKPRCAYCGRTMREPHPPYLIAHDLQIHGPYHAVCVEPATENLPELAWRKRDQAAIRRRRQEQA